MAQQVLNITTYTASIRSEAWGWTANDPSLLVEGKLIGFTPSFRGFHTYETVMHALADGWKLLSAPEVISNEVCYWWLVRDSER